MKKIIFLTFCFLGFYGFTYTQVSHIRTVSSAANSPGRYVTLQAAIDSANVGDTIYVHGGGYNTMTVNKRLTFIGPGFNPQGQFTAQATINYIYLDNIVPSTSANGSKFIGLNIGYIAIKPIEQFKIDSILIERCRFYTLIATNVLGDSWTFRNNLFQWGNYYTGGSLSINFRKNIIIENNIFASVNGSTQIQNSNDNTVFFFNNLFTGHFDNATEFLSVSNARFENNIFYGKSPSTAASSNFANNIFFGNLVSNSLANLSDGLNNITLDPQFTTVPIDNSKYYFSYSNNYKLLPTSPGHNAGTDGTDIGIFGGQYPMPLNNLIITGEPPIPQIYYMFIQNSVIDPNTPINVNIKARKMN